MYDILFFASAILIIDCMLINDLVRKDMLELDFTEYIVLSAILSLHIFCG